MIARLLRSADFERVLRSRSRASSAHFAVHHTADEPSVATKPARKPVLTELSTGVDCMATPAVDDLPLSAPLRAPAGVWVGAVVPKRHARRSVTRSLLKRQIRSAAAGQESGLPAGLWVVRLRAPFDRTQFVSAGSEALRRAARAELEAVLASAALRIATR